MDNHEIDKQMKARTEKFSRSSKFIKFLHDNAEEFVQRVILTCLILILTLLVLPHVITWAASELRNVL